MKGVIQVPAPISFMLFHIEWHSWQADLLLFCLPFLSLTWLSVLRSILINVVQRKIMRWKLGWASWNFLLTHFPYSLGYLGHNHFSLYHSCAKLSFWIWGELKRLSWKNWTKRLQRIVELEDLGFWKLFIKAGLCIIHSQTDLRGGLWELNVIRHVKYYTL